MRLMFLDSIEPEVYGGMEEWVCLVASGLVSRGHRVRVVGRPGSRFLERMERETSGVQLTALAISGDFNPATISTLKKLMEEDGTEIVVTNFNKDLRLGGLAARLDGTVRVVWSVGLDITKDSLVHRFLTPRLFDGVLVPSESLKQQITHHGYIPADSVTVVPIGIPDKPPSLHDRRGKAREEFAIPATAIVAVTLGRLVEQKGHSYLLAALALIRERFPDLYLLLCGDGPLERELRKQAADLGMTGRIIFAGMLSDIEPALRAADLMVHPSIEEPFGIAVLEGMRAGLPIVASNVGGIPEVLADTGILVAAKDPVALADALCRALSDQVALAEMGSAGRKRFVERFSQDTMITRLEGYFETTVRSERTHG